MKHETGRSPGCLQKYLRNKVHPPDDQSSYYYCVRIAVTVFLILTRELDKNTGERVIILLAGRDSKQISDLTNAASRALSHSAAWTLSSHGNMNPVSETCGKRAV